MERTGQVFLILTLSFRALACLFVFLYFAYITTRIDSSTDVYLQRSKVRNDIHLSLSRRTVNRTKRGLGDQVGLLPPYSDDDVSDFRLKCCGLFNNMISALVLY
jgi:hypothetical protein